MNKIRVIIADDHIHATEGMQKIISEANDMECVGSTTELLEISALVKHNSPDVLVLDIAWLGDKQAGIHILPDIRRIRPNLPVIMVTVYPELIEPARQTGAFTLSKGFSRQELLSAIRWAAHQKEPLASPPAPVEITPLTYAEQKVLSLIVKGMPDKQIAKELGRSEGTVKKHVVNILRKLHATNRTEAAILAERYHLLKYNNSEGEDDGAKKVNESTKK